MFAKTFRSVVALVMVCVLMIGIGGNAVVQALNIPGSGAVDTRVDSVIGQLNDQIDALEKQIDEMWDLVNKEDPHDGKQSAVEMLQDAEQKLVDAQVELDKLTGPDGDVTKANEQLADAKEKLEEAKALQMPNKQAELKQEANDLAQAEFDKLFAEKEEEAWEEFYDLYADTYAEKLAEYNDKVAQARADMEAGIAQKKAEMEAGIADKKAEMEEELAAEREKLDEELALIGADEAAIEEAHKQFAQKEAEIRAKFDAEATALREEFAAKEVEIRAECDRKEAEAWETFNDIADEGLQQKIVEVQEKIAQARIEAQQKFDEEFEKQFTVKLADLMADLNVKLPLFQAEYDKVEKYVNDVNAAVKYFEGEIVKAQAVVDQAYDLVYAANATIDKARITIADARTLVNNLEKSYNDLNTLITSPRYTLTHVQESYTKLVNDYNALFEGLLTLDEDIDNVILAYEAMNNVEIDEINVHYDTIPGVTINVVTIWVDRNGDGEIQDNELEGIKEVKYLDPIDFSDYEFTFTKADIPEIPEMPAMLTTLDGYMDTIVAKAISLDVALRHYVAVARKAVSKALDIAEEHLGITIDWARQNLNRSLLVKVYNWLYENPDKVCSLVKKYGIMGLGLVTHYGPYALDLIENHHELLIKVVKYGGGAALIGLKWLDSKDIVLEYTGKAYDFVKQYRDEVAALASKLYAKYGDEAKALIMVYVDYLNLEERLHDAMYASYVIGGPNYYVALGDESSALWADELLTALGLDEEDYKNLTGSKLSIEDTVAANLDEIKKADIITIGYSNTAFKYAVEQLQYKLEDYEPDTIDWAELVGEHYAEALKNALKRFENGIRNNTNINVDAVVEVMGVSYTVKDLMMLLAESYLYDYITYILESRRAVNEIHNVNEDALVVLVGMSNPFEGVTLTVGGRSLPIGTAYDALIEAVDCYYLAYAFVNEKTIFVNAPHVETGIEARELTVQEFALELSTLDLDKLNPTAAGAEYIKDQIMDHLTLKILGDVNGDGRVSIFDAILTLRYLAGLATAEEADLEVMDVNFDGRYGCHDAIQILRYIAGILEYFYPVK